MSDLTNNEQDEFNIYSYNHEEYKKFKEELKKKTPIRKGCKNEQCYCSGACNKIIGYRNNETGEEEYNEL